MPLSAMLSSTPCNEIEITPSAMLVDLLCNLYETMKLLTLLRLNQLTYVPIKKNTQKIYSFHISFTIVTFQKTRKITKFQLVR